MFIGQHFSEFNLKKKYKSVGVEQMSKKKHKNREHNPLQKKFFI